MAVAFPARVTGGSGVELNAAMTSFLTRLRATVPASVPIYVTSGYRSPEAQARALVVKRNLGDDLRALYGSRVAPVLAAENTMEAMSAALRAQIATGLYLSRHMRGDALDLRTQGLTSAQVAAIQRAAEALGAKTLLETKPPHLHIERVGGGLLATVPTPVKVGVVGFGIVGLALALFLFYRARARKVSP